MPDQKIQEDTVNESAATNAARAIVNSANMRVAVSNPALAQKVRINIDDDGPIFWYIKFNIVLDALSVTKKTMTVTETDGYILDTEISYDTARDFIVIKPVDPYEEGIFYILTITRKVRSKGGNHLKRDIHILFKIKDKRIEEYKLLPPNVEVAKPKKKPASLKAQTAARAYGFTPEQRAKIEKMPKDKLLYGKVQINIALATIGIITALIGLLVNITVIVLTGAGILVLGILHIGIQFINKKCRAAFLYNTGVMLFNAGLFKAAKKRFARASALDDLNELAEYALRKSEFYAK